MAFIPQISEEQAIGPLQRIYQAAVDRAGKVANIIKVMSLDPRSLNGSMQLYGNVMKTENALSAAQRELLAAVVSNINDCYY